MAAEMPSQALAPYSVLMPLAPWEPVEIVAQALESLDAQTWPASQVVVSCDGAPPAPLQSLLKAVDLPIEIVVGPGGEGVGPVLARGLLQCREELVLRADADDLSVPERAALQVSWMQNNTHVLVTGTPINEFEVSADQPLMQRWVPLRPDAIARVALTRNPLNHPSVILRRSAVLAAGNYSNVPGFEDYELWLRLLAIYGSQALANIPLTLVLVRVGLAHLGRRHGRSYAMAELKFLLRCGFNRLLPWACVARLVVCRLPLRLVPAVVLSWAMERVTRHRIAVDPPN
jgi:hypothetical protein